MSLSATTLLARLTDLRLFRGTAARTERLDIPADAPTLPESDDDPATAALRDALRAVIDPELGLDIVSLGLVHRLTRTAERVALELLVTTPACPLGEHLQREAARALRAADPQLAEVDVVLRRDLAWHPRRMDPTARSRMGW